MHNIHVRVASILGRKLGSLLDFPHLHQAHHLVRHLRGGHVRGHVRGLGQQLLCIRGAHAPGWHYWVFTVPARRE